MVVIDSDAKFTNAGCHPIVNIQVSFKESMQKQQEPAAKH